MSNTVNVSNTTNQVVITPQSTKTVSVNSGGDTSIAINQGAANTINISNNVVDTSLTPNNITIATPPSNGITVTDLSTTIAISQTQTDIVQIASQGPQGPKGNTGATGPQGPAQNTGSLLVTASYSNPNLTLTKGDGSTFDVGISTTITTPTLAEVTSQGSSTTTAITASIISTSGAITSSNLSGNNTGDQDLSSLASITQLNASSSTLQTNIDAKVSNASTASFAITGSNVMFANITSSGNISASGNITASSTLIEDGNALLKLNHTTNGQKSRIDLVEGGGTFGAYMDYDSTDFHIGSINGGVDTNTLNIARTGVATFNKDVNISLNSKLTINLDNDTTNASLAIIDENTNGDIFTIRGTGAQNDATLFLSGSSHFKGNITSSGNISASGNLSGSSLHIEGTTKNIVNSTTGFRVSGYTDLKYLENTGNNTLQWRTNGDAIFEIRSQNGSNNDTYIHFEHASLPGPQNVSVGVCQDSGSFIIARDEGFAENNDFTITGSNGFIGINNPNPTERLTVSGNISASSTLLGGGLNINGPSNSHVEVGTYNVGFDTLSNPAVATQITGSGLIISGNMADQNHHNMVKIGDIELVDVNTLTTPNQFLIHNAKSFKITSGSDGGDITTQNRLMEHDGTNFKVYSGNDAKITVSNTNITLNASNGPSFRAPNSTIATHFNSFFSDPDATPAAVRSIAKGDMFAVIGEGHVTASAVSSSGTSSFAQISLPDLPTSDPGIAGRLFTTQSTGTGGNLDGQKILLVSAG